MKKLIAMGALLATTAMSGAALAAEGNTHVEGKAWDAKERFMVRGRMIGVIPNESSSTSAGGVVEAGNAYVPEVDLTYFATDNVAFELIAATAQHSMKGNNVGGPGNLDLGDVMLLPPTLTAQYHFNPHGTYRPYVGAGVGYIFFYNEDKGAATSIKYEDGWHTALQAGMDVSLGGNWVANIDVKKLFHNVDATVNGAVQADVDLDPWIVGTGVGYRF